MSNDLSVEWEFKHQLTQCSEDYEYYRTLKSQYKKTTAFARHLKHAWARARLKGSIIGRWARRDLPGQGSLAYKPHSS